MGRGDPCALIQLHQALAALAAGATEPHGNQLPHILNGLQCTLKRLQSVWISQSQIERNLTLQKGKDQLPWQAKRAHCMVQISTEIPHSELSAAHLLLSLKDFLLVSVSSFSKPWITDGLFTLPVKIQDDKDQSSQRGILVNITRNSISQISLKPRA